MPEIALSSLQPKQSTIPDEGEAMHVITAPKRPRAKPIASAASKSVTLEPTHEGNLKLVLDAIPCSVCVTTTNGQLKYANALFRQSLGLDNGHLHNVIALLASTFLMPELTTWASAREESTLTIQQEMDFNRFTVDAKHDDTNRWYQLVVQRDNSYAEDGLLITLFDIHDRVLQEKSHQEHQSKLFYASKVMSVGEMASVIAHELNHPLATCINFLSGVERRILNPDIEREQLTEPVVFAKEQAQRAIEIIRRIREFVRPREPKQSALAMGDVFEAINRWLRLTCSTDRIELVVNLASGLPTVMADAVMIEQVLVNLSKNAVEALLATPGKRKLTLGAKQEDSSNIVVWVADSGDGISPEKAMNLFTPFSSSKQDGMGIGLTICRSIVEYHGGRLWYEPDGSSGACFMFTLPIQRT